MGLREKTFSWQGLKVTVATALTVPAIHSISTFFLFFVTTFWPRVSSNSFTSVCVRKDGRPVQRKNRKPFIATNVTHICRLLVRYENKIELNKMKLNNIKIHKQNWNNVNRLDKSSILSLCQREKERKLLCTHILVAPFQLMICNTTPTSQSSSGLFFLAGRYLRTCTWRKRMRSWSSFAKILKRICPAEKKQLWHMKTWVNATFLICEEEWVC